MFKNLFVFKKGKKGFTLIELLAVIVILGIIMALIIPEVTKTIEKSQIKSAENSVRGLMRAVDIAQKENALDGDLDTITFTYQNGNESSSVGNLKLDYTGKRLQDGKVVIDADGNIALALYDGKYCIEKDYESDDIIITKTLLDDCDFDIPIYYTDASGANRPRLLKGMTAIVWDESTSDWVEASNINDPDSQNWFDYSEKKWANAKTVDSDGGIAYWVWIPRYAYKITSGFHQPMEEGGTIDIEFLRGTSNNPKNNTKIETSGYDGSENGKNTGNNYFLHPAFIFGEDNVSGFWVAKFEPSMVSNKIKIVPNVSPVISRTVSEFFDLGLGMKEYICGGQCDARTDTHMMKNMEWGAVAYLSQSEYGITTKVECNENSDYYTGGGEGNAYINNTNQSTTGTIYGIYDMSGGANEYVMGNLNKILGNSGLNPSEVDSKYIDVYTVSSTDNAQDNYEAAQDIYGDAIWETSSSGNVSTSWYTAYSYFVWGNTSWFSRGGHHESDAAGVFCFHNSDGFSYYNNSFRPVALR